MATHRMYCTEEDTRHDPVAFAQETLNLPWFGKESHWKHRRITGARWDYDKSLSSHVLVVEYEADTEARPKLARRKANGSQPKSERTDV